MSLLQSKHVGFTKLGHIKDTTHLKEVLGKGSVQVTLLMK